MRVLHISSEVAPWAKTGGLGDVVGALPDALHRADGVFAAAVLPLYRTAKQALAKKGLTPQDTGIVADVSLGAMTGRAYAFCDSIGPVTRQRSSRPTMLRLIETASTGTKTKRCASCCCASRSSVSGRSSPVDRSTSFMRTTGTRH